jgi:hypothetical protein
MTFFPFYFVLIVLPATASAQGIKDPSTPRSTITVNPSEQPVRPTATPNVPSRVTAPPLGVRRVYPYRNGARTSGSYRR